MSALVLIGAMVGIAVVSFLAGLIAASLIHECSSYSVTPSDYAPGSTEHVMREADGLTGADESLPTGNDLLDYENAVKTLARLSPTPALDGHTPYRAAFAEVGRLRRVLSIKIRKGELS